MHCFFANIMIFSGKRGYYIASHDWNHYALIALLTIPSEMIRYEPHGCYQTIPCVVIWVYYILGDALSTNIDASHVVVI